MFRSVSRFADESSKTTASFIHTAGGAEPSKFRDENVPPTIIALYLSGRILAVQHTRYTTAPVIVRFN